MSRFRTELGANRAALEWEPKQGYLRSLLRALGIDPSSQTLVFSRTSLQTDFISRRTPRAIYFNDQTYVGWIPGAPLIEIMSVHPTRGIVFTTLPSLPPKGGRSSFRTETEECFRCHGGRVPNLFARSVHAGPSGYSRPFSRAFEMTPRQPLKNRWGGWYVSGRHGDQRHMGNVVSEGTDERPTLDREKGANVTDLRPLFDAGKYLTPHSDLVALMVLESQMDVQNAIVRAGVVARPGLDGAPVTPEEIADAGEPLVEALLGVDETRLTAPIEGTSEFARLYPATAPKDGRGRSLGELDLRTRLYRYGCSPLVYAPSFDALPAPAREYVWRRFAAIFDGKDADLRYAHLDRPALREILSATKPEFASFLAR